MAGTVEIATTSSGGSRDRAAGRGGVLLLAVAAITKVMVGARLASGTDQGTLLASVGAVAGSRRLYFIFSVARLAWGLALIVAPGTSGGLAARCG